MIKHHDQASGSSIRIKHQDQVSGSSITIKHQDQLVILPVCHPASLSSCHHVVLSYWSSCCWTFVRVKFVLRIYSDIHLYNLVIRIYSDIRSCRNFYKCHTLVQILLSLKTSCCSLFPYYTTCLFVCCNCCICLFVCCNCFICLFVCCN